MFLASLEFIKKLLNHILNFEVALKIFSKLYDYFIWLQFIKFLLNTQLTGKQGAVQSQT